MSAMTPPELVKGEEPKPKSIPSGVHLTRRGDYLLRALREYHEQQELEHEQSRDGFNGHHTTQSTTHHSYSAAEAQHRPTNMHGSRPPVKANNASSHPPKKQHVMGQLRHPKAHHHSPPPRAASKSSSDLTEEAEEEEELEEDEDSMDEDECKEAMRPVKKELKELRADESRSIGGAARGNLHNTPGKVLLCLLSN